ncbi:MAG: hypothetical protein LAP85_21950 [Acidobacteriia bacterium]|nr:hypothetical protein [Terriglobia bacterium]
MIEVGFEVVSAFNGGIDEAGTIATKRVEERARVAALVGACPLETGIESAQATVRPEVGALPESISPNTRS